MSPRGGAAGAGGANCVVKTTGGGSSNWGRKRSDAGLTMGNGWSGARLDTPPCLFLDTARALAPLPLREETVLDTYTKQRSTRVRKTKPRHELVHWAQSRDLLFLFPEPALCLARPLPLIMC